MSKHNKKDVKSTNEKVEELKDTVSSTDENHDTNKESENVEMSSVVENEPDVIIETTDESFMNEENISVNTDSVVCDSDTNIESDIEEEFDLSKSEALSYLVENMSDKEYFVEPCEIERPQSSLSQTLEQIKNIESDEVLSDVDKLTPSDKLKREVVLEQVRKLYSSKQSFVTSQITLGITLVDIKKEVKDRFFNIVDEEVLPKKQVHRLMKFVLKENVDYRKCMKISLSNDETRENLKSLELDTRVTDLVMRDLSKFHNISMSKINKMKPLSDEDFEKVVIGDDRPFKDYLENLKEENKKVSNNKHYEKKPKKMTDEEFDELYKKSKYELINQSNSKDSYIKKLKKENKLKSEETDTLNKLLTARDIEIKLLKTNVNFLTEISLNTRQFKMNDNMSSSKSELEIQSVAS